LLIANKKDGKIFIGMSFCREGDEYNEERADQIAIARSIKLYHGSLKKVQARVPIEYHADIIDFVKICKSAFSDATLPAWAVGIASFKF